MASKKIGQRNPSKTLKQILRDVPKFVRTDPGGSSALKQIHRRLADHNIPITSDTIAAYKIGAVCTRHTIHEYIKPQIEQARKLVG